jgi:formylglycine-generating enzyme required for sulfatase activity
MRLHFIPGGTFRMGALPEFEAAEPDERPLHEVRISAFWMDETEVTWSLYERCVGDGGCSAAAASADAIEAATHPVTSVTWQQAAAYCTWAGRRLPTEAEWEKGARGRDARRYPWGWVGAPESNHQIRLNFCDSSCSLPFSAVDLDDGWPQTAPVGSYPAGLSPYGLLDMAGNVWEWTADWYAADAYQSTSDSDPAGPANGQRRVIRGGAWTEPLFHGVVLGSRTTNRFWNEPDRPRPDLGFRCALTAAGG